jgi:hypothetical protein
MAKVFQISGYMNTTRVALAKVQFVKVLQPHVESKIQQLVDNLKIIKDPMKNIQRFPYKAFPEMVKGLNQYNKSQKALFLMLYYDHNPIGLIKEDIPRAILQCKSCKKQYSEAPKEILEYELNWWQKFIKKIFKESYEPPLLSNIRLKCTCGGLEFKGTII